MKDDISLLFQTRDTAVEKQDRKLFLSTQVDEILGGSSDGYLGINKMKSEVLHVHDETEITKVVFVKETYFPPKTESYSSYPVYFLVNTLHGWKIYRVK